MKLILQNRLAKYAGSAAALLGSAPLAAQIQYFDVNPDLVMQGNNAQHNVDLDQDGNDDFQFLTIDQSFGGTPYGKVQVVGLQAGAEIFGEVTNGYSYASLLQNGDGIDANGNFNGGGVLAEFPAFGGTPRWDGGVGEGFLGFKFNVGGQNHFGWMRLEVPANAKTAILKDLAFNLTPDAAISAGQTVGLIERFRQECVATQNGQILNLSVSADMLPLQFDLIDLQGKTVFSHLMLQTEEEIGLNEALDGVYVLRWHNQAMVYNTKALLKP